MSFERLYDARYVLHDSEDNPVNDLLAIPTHVNSETAQARLARGPAHFAHRLCVLPPKAAGALPSLIEPRDGCWTPPRQNSQSFRDGLCADSSSFRWGTFGRMDLDPKCAFRAVIDEAPTDPVGLGYCLPLDDPILASRGIFPVPVPYNATSGVSMRARSKLRIENRVVSTLKHQLLSRNHSAAFLPMFTNVTVRPVHERLRLGICVAFPPIGSPCSLSAVDDVTGTIADGWFFPYSNVGYDEGLDLSLALPHAAYSPLVGSTLNTFDHGDTMPPPFPFLTAKTNRYGDWTSLDYAEGAWSIPLVKCVAPNSNSSMGVVRPLVITGPCTSNRDCLSGICSPASGPTRLCNNNNDTDNPFSLSFVIPPKMSRSLTYPPNAAVREMIATFRYTSISKSYLPSEWTYYVPAMIVCGVAASVVIVGAMWIQGRGFVDRLKRKVTGWRTTTERDFELKPVSGAVVRDMGDVRELGESVDELPQYADDRQE